MKWLSIAAELIHAIWIKIQEKKRQREYDNLKENPSDWFNGHFGGMRDKEHKD